MSDIDEDKKKELKAFIQVGLTAQSLAAIAVYAMKEDKKEFLRELKALIEKFLNSLTEEEKLSLRKDLDSMMESKAEEFVTNLGVELNEEEMKEALSYLKEVGQFPL